MQDTSLSWLCTLGYHQVAACAPRLPPVTGERLGTLLWVRLDLWSLPSYVTQRQGYFIKRLWVGVAKAEAVLILWMLNIGLNIELDPKDST